MLIVKAGINTLTSSPGCQGVFDLPQPDAAQDVQRRLDGCRPCCSSPRAQVASAGTICWCLLMWQSPFFQPGHRWLYAQDQGLMPALRAALQGRSTCTQCWSSSRPALRLATSWAVITPTSCPTRPAHHLLGLCLLGLLAGRACCIFQLTRLQGRGEPIWQLWGHSWPCMCPWHLPNCNLLPTRQKACLGWCLLALQVGEKYLLV